MKLYITEKPSQVEALREALKRNNMLNGVVIVPLVGHIMSLYDFADYDKSLSDSWINLVIDNRVPFFPKTLKKKVKPKSTFISKGKKITSDYKKKFNDVKEKINKADDIIIASDPDNEGATLVMEIIEECKANDKVLGMINMSKLDIASLSKEVKILNKIPYYNMYQAGDSRAYFDQTFGINTSIIATVALGNGKTLQIGGVKLPTIRMVVERDLEFEKHTEIPFWNVKAKAKYDDKIFDIEIYLKDSEKDIRFLKEAEALDVKNQVENIMKGETELYSESKKKQAPPKPYSLTDLQSEAGKRYKLSADDTLKIAQKLYADYKIQSYPRTDSNYYAEGEYNNVSEILNNLATIDNFKDLITNIKNISRPIKRKIFDDSKIDAHTALSPTLDAKDTLYSKLNGIEKKIFNLVAIRYVMQFLDDYEYLEIKGNGFINDSIKFKFSESVSEKTGWKIATDFTPIKRTIPHLNKGDMVEIVDINITKGYTKPKPRFTEATLLKAMEKVHRFFDDEEVKKQLGENGIGTPATRAMILEQLKSARKGDEPYLKIEKGKIVSTKKARDLIRTIPKDISSPILRANMESKLKKIVKGELSKEEYFQEVKEVVTKINKRILSLGKIPDKKSNKEEPSGIDLKCPLCGNEIVEDSRVFKCSTQKYSHGRVSGCKFTIFKNSKILGRDINTEDLKKLLNNQKIGGDRADLTLDLENKYFLKAEWKNNYNNNTDLDELRETPKAYSKNGKMVWKDFRGKALTKAQAEKLLDGKKIKLKRKSKAGKNYEVIILLKDDKGHLQVDFV